MPGEGDRRESYSSTPKAMRVRAVLPDIRARGSMFIS
jgi:hypothetical protein